MKQMFLILLLSFALNASEAEQAEQAGLTQTISLLKGWSYGMSSTQANRVLKDLSSDQYFPYQDITINGETIWKGTGPDCSSRYTAIAAALACKYNRSFSVLDIGANNGYFSLNLARDYNAKVVMADTTDRLTKICTYNTDSNKNLLYCKKQFSTDDLNTLPAGTHFDAVLLLNVLHHIPDWKPFIEKISSLSDTLIVENPPSNDPRCSYKTTIPAIQTHLEQLKAPVIARTPRSQPGFFQDLKTMEFQMTLEVPVLPNVQSVMHVVHMGKRENMTPLFGNMFQQCNVQYEGTQFHEFTI